MGLGTVEPLVFCFDTERKNKTNDFPTHFPFLIFQMCAGGEAGKDSCQGDSGGPLLSQDMVGPELRWHIQGIVSTGPKECGKANNPAIYTRVSKYLTWILDNMRD